jgi:hypothetical protein
MAFVFTRIAQDIPGFIETGYVFKECIRDEPGPERIARQQDGFGNLVPAACLDVRCRYHAVSPFLR